MATQRSAVWTWSRLEALGTPRARRVVGIVSFAVLTALGAKLAVPLPGTAVPFTFQPLAVLLAGALLGPRLGAASQAVYLGAGLAGLPVFAVGLLASPTGGYLLAYPFAAFAVGALASGSWVRNLGALLCGLGVIYTGGVAWLALMTGWSNALLLGVAPFVLADLVKVAMAGVIVGRIGRPSRALFGG